MSLLSIDKAGVTVFEVDDVGLTPQIHRGVDRGRCRDVDLADAEVHSAQPERVAFPQVDAAAWLGYRP